MTASTSKARIAKIYSIHENPERISPARKHLVPPCCHGLNGFNFLERFGKSHPEYFALLDNGQRHNNPAMPHPGQLCLTSGITEEIYQDIKAYLQGRPASERGAVAFGKSAWAFTTFRKPYVDVMPQDSFYPCKCDKCQAAFTSETYYASKLVWGNVIDWAERLKQDGVEGQLNMMAYHPYRGIPQRAIPDNVNVMVAETGPGAKPTPNNWRERMPRSRPGSRSWGARSGSGIMPTSSATAPCPGFLPRHRGR